MTTVQQTIGIQKGCGISVAPIFRRANPKYPKYLKWLNVSRSLEDNDDNCGDINPKDPNRESKAYWQKIIGLAKGCFQILFPGYDIGHIYRMKARMHRRQLVCRRAQCDIGQVVFRVWRGTIFRGGTV